MRAMGMLAATLAFGGAGALTRPAAAASDWPTRSVDVIVPWSAGGGSDALARIIFDEVAAQTGQAFPLEFRPGAVGTIGSAEVAKNSEPDGYTLLFTSGTPIVTANFMPNVSYDPKTDLLPVVEILSGPTMLVANAKAPYNNFKELIEYAKANPGKVNVAFNGVGSNTHYLASVMGYKTGAKFNLVPYSGVGDQLADLMSGTVDAGFGFSPGFMSGVKAGKLKFIATMAPDRNPQLPDVGTSEESPYKGVSRVNWYGVLVPKGTPRDVIDKVNAVVHNAINKPEVKKKIEDLGYFVVTNGTPEDFKATIEQEVSTMKALIDSGVFKVSE